MDLDNDNIDALRRETLDAAWRCIDKLASELARDYERCGKAACARSRRCRGFACLALARDE